MSEIFDNIYTSVFSVNSEIVLLLALIKYMLYSHCTQGSIFLYFLEVKNLRFVTKNCSKSSYICTFILSKKQRNSRKTSTTQKWLAVRRKLPDPIAFLMFCRLVYNIHSHFNKIILA